MHAKDLCTRWDKRPQLQDARARHLSPNIAYK